MAEVEPELERLARGQTGLVTTSQAREVLGRHDAEHWRRTGRLVSVQPGVHRLATHPPTWHQDLLAAVLASDGVVSHRAAAELWGVVEPEGCVEVTTPARPRQRLRPPAVVHVGVRRAERRLGLPVTDPLETLCDLSLVAPQWVLNAALEAALGTRLLSIHALEHLLQGEVARRETEVEALRALLRPRALPTSAEEAALADQVDGLLGDPALGLRSWWFEVWHEGRFVARPDAGDPVRRLAVVVERQGDRWQAVPDPRAERLRAAGWRVVRGTSRELRRDPSRLHERIAQAVAQRVSDV